MAQNLQGDAMCPTRKAHTHTMSTCPGHMYMGEATP